MIEQRTAYGFPAIWYGDQWTPPESGALRIACIAVREPFAFNRIPPIPTKLERAQACAAEVRARRGMVVKRITEQEQS